MERGSLEKLRFERLYATLRRAPKSRTELVLRV
jgi:hypothetical protein